MKNKRRTIELGIFALFSLVFLNSLYGWIAGNFLPEKAKEPAYRSIASSPEGITESYSLQCQGKPESLKTRSHKLRILGAYCGLVPISRNDDRSVAAVNQKILKELRVTNKTTAYSATIFSDNFNRRFSTDFIPLQSGKNTIEIGFQYETGDTYDSQIFVEKE